MAAAEAFSAICQVRHNGHRGGIYILVRLPYLRRKGRGTTDLPQPARVAAADANAGAEDTPRAPARLRLPTRPAISEHHAAQGRAANKRRCGHTALLPKTMVLATFRATCGGQPPPPRSSRGALLAATLFQLTTASGYLPQAIAASKTLTNSLTVSPSLPRHPLPMTAHESSLPCRQTSKASAHRRSSPPRHHDTYTQRPDAHKRQAEPSTAKLCACGSRQAWQDTTPLQWRQMSEHRRSEHTATANDISNFSLPVI